MGTRTHTVVFDDLDHSTEDIGTYRFALEGKQYEIDLSPANRQRLHAALHPFIAAARRLATGGGGAARRTVTPSRTSTSKVVRRFWHDNWQRLGLPEPRVNGPIPREVHEAYEKSQ